MEFLVGFLLAVGVVFALSVFMGPPYLRTHKVPIETALDLLGVKKDTHILDLGSGDGSVLIAAAKRGAYATGYEINPFLVLVSRWRSRKYRRQITIHWADMWRAEINKNTQNVFMFMDRRFTETTENYLSKSGEKLKFASYSYELPNIESKESRDGVHLYEFGD